MKFTLEIELGNDSMQIPSDVGSLLMRLGRRFEIGQDGFDIRDSGKLIDPDGNRVGKWEVVYPKPEFLTLEDLVKD